MKAQTEKQPKEKPFHINRLALRAAVPIALAISLAAGIGVVLLGAGWLQIALAVVGMAVVAFLVAYRSVHRKVAHRLELAGETLRAARKRRFETLTTLPLQRERDELDALIYQVRRAGLALQNEIERLERMENYRREFLGDVSHELRTPIFAVSGFAENLLEGALDDETVRQRFVEKILSNARRLEALTRDLSAISKLETGELGIEAVPFDLADPVREAAESLEMLASEKEIRLDVTLPPSLPKISGDQERIRQVLVNLIENAIKYNDADGRVAVTAKHLSDRSVRIAIVDDGIGIPENVLPRLTERFYRVDKSRSRAQGGTGLGLAIVKHILEAHGARLTVESQVDHGSTFAFTLPEAE